MFVTEGTIYIPDVKTFKACFKMHSYRLFSSVNQRGQFQMYLIVPLCCTINEYLTEICWCDASETMFIITAAGSF